MKRRLLLLLFREREREREMNTVFDLVVIVKEMFICKCAYMRVCVLRAEVSEGGRARVYIKTLYFTVFYLFFFSSLPQMQDTP